MNCPPYQPANVFRTRWKGVPLVLPLRAHYARSAVQEKRRRDFYTTIARELEFEGWDRVRKAEPLIDVAPGRDGHEQDLQDPTLKRTHFLDRRASVADFLSCGALLDDPLPEQPSDRQRGLARVYGDIRRNIALALAKDRELMTSALKSVDWMGGGGGSQAGNAMPSMDAGDAAIAFQRLAEFVPPHLMLILHDAILCDRYVWEVKSGRGKKERLSARGKREDLLEQLREALDYAALAYGHLPSNRTVDRDGKPVVIGPWEGRMIPRWQSARDIEVKRAADWHRRVKAAEG